MPGLSPMGTAEAWLGAVIIAAAVVDLLLTILYAKIGDRGLSRFGAGVGSVFVARATWWLLRRIAPLFGRHGRALLSLSGPLSVLLVLAMWVLSLVIGAALVIQPHLADSIAASSGRTPTDFLTAMYAAAASLALGSASDLAPRSPGMRGLYLLDALIGTMVVALVISYVMQIYTALRTRNSLALSLHLLSRETGDASEVLAGLGPRGDFAAGQNVIAGLATSMVSVEEAHHFYPLLFFFHTSAAEHSLVRCLRLALDTVSHLRACLDDERYGGLKDSGSVHQLQRATMLLVETLSKTFLPHRLEGEIPDDGPQAHWREQYLQSCRRLAAAGIATRSDGADGARAYDASRAEWDACIRRISIYLAQEEDDPDRRSRAAAGGVDGSRPATR
jgi:hypothetical protein